MSVAQVNPREVSRLLNCLSGIPLFTTTTDKATARKVLESEFVFCNGLMRDIKVKHLGVGVYKLYSKERP